jgi:hypothetical protein
VPIVHLIKLCHGQAHTIDRAITLNSERAKPFPKMSFFSLAKDARLKKFVLTREEYFSILIAGPAVAGGKTKKALL